MATLNIRTTSGVKEINLTTTQPADKPYVAIQGSEDVLYAPLKYTQCGGAGIRTATGSFFLSDCTTLEKYRVCCVSYDSAQCLRCLTVSSGLTDPSCGFDLCIYPPSGACYTRNHSYATSSLTQYYNWAFANNMWYTAFCTYCDSTLLYGSGLWLAGYGVPDSAPLWCCPNTMHNSSNSFANYTSTIDVQIDNGMGGPNNNICRTWAAQQGVGMAGGNWYFCDSASCMQMGWWTCAGTSWNIANTSYTASAVGGYFCYYAHERSLPRATVVTNIKPTNKSPSVVFKFCTRNSASTYSGIATLPTNCAFGSDFMSCLASPTVNWWQSGGVDNRSVFEAGCVVRTMGPWCYACISSEGNMNGWYNNTSCATSQCPSAHSDYIVEVWGWRYV